MCRHTLFTIIVYLEMYRDTFMIEIYPEMYHHTVSLSVSSRFVLRSVFLRLHARFLGVVWSFEHTCLSRCFLPRFTVESVQCRNESIRRHPVSRVVQRTLGKYAALAVGVDQVETWLSFPCYRPSWKSGILAVYVWTSLVV